ncbi:STAS domain-containing protein [Streptomyces sp. TRM66268-LWL]|uniref:Anti-sigma factor antagonist n=1 Tax=Streptomyces polyasparticus TaxID=2767826 RepID=A0ABR7SII8_9ACTN|nr:STAS domain-containing protein [Streptomyces polyasparticus]MBC9714779.1 STAS domain-containing protein [Streptomyces polyasparticus]
MGSQDDFTFGLRHHVVGNTLVLVPQGELDAWAGQHLAAPVTELLRRPRPDVIVDLRALTFLDAGGLRLLLRIREQVADHQGTLRLIRGQPRIWLVFRLTRLESAFTVLDRPPAPIESQYGEDIPA